MGIIRVYLALSVVVWHVWYKSLGWTANGYISVLLFFIISGFYMSMVLNSTYKNIPLPQFYLSRALRLYPLYFVVLICVVTFNWATHQPIETPSSSSDWLNYIFSNVTFVELNLLYANWRLVPPAWSLAIEVAFYALVPFVARLPIKWIVLAFAGFLIFRLSYLNTDFTAYRYAYTGQDMCFFFLGVLSHRLWNLKRPSFSARQVIALALGIVLFGSVIPLSEVADVDRLQNWLFYLCFAAALPIIFDLTKSSRLDRFIGDLSYPIYISHWTALAIVGHFYGSIFSFVSYDYHQPILVFAVVLIAIGLHLLVEKPVEAMRKRLRREPQISSPPRSQNGQYSESPH